MSLSTTVDANRDFWQVQLVEEEEHKTSFTTHVGLSEFVRIPFRLTNAPPTFRIALDMVLAGFTWKTCLVYIYAIAIFSRSIEEHIIHVTKILSSLTCAVISLKWKKCDFFHAKIRYFVQVISQQAVGWPVSHKVAKRSETAKDSHGTSQFPESSKRLPMFYSGICQSGCVTKYSTEEPSARKRQWVQTSSCARWSRSPSIWKACWHDGLIANTGAASSGSKIFDWYGRIPGAGNNVSEESEYEDLIDGKDEEHDNIDYVLANQEEEDEGNPSRLAIEEILREQSQDQLRQDPETARTRKKKRFHGRSH